jgi:hypothetical protein
MPSDAMLNPLLRYPMSRASAPTARLRIRAASRRAPDGRCADDHLRANFRTRREIWLCQAKRPTLQTNAA